MQVILDSLTKSYGARCLLDNVTFEFRSGKKSVLVGKNGSGKSTILSIIAGLVEADAGRVVVSSGSVALMEQRLSGDLSRTVQQSCSDLFADLDEQETKINAMHERFESLSDREHQQYSSLVESFEAADGYDRHRRVKNVLNGIGFSNEEFSKPLSTLSGGQQRRYMLARILLQNPDLLLLDEPTNHLDISSILWLENWLKSKNSTVIFISHDRTFLESVADEIVELDACSLFRYPANYAQFRQMRTERREQQAKLFQQQQAYIEKNEDFIRRNISGQKTRQAQARRKMLEKIERLEPPKRDNDYSFTIQKMGNEGHVVVQAEALSKSFGEIPILQDVEFTVYRGEKIGILGMNGSGKSTLLRLIVGDLEADAGSVTVNSMASIGYFAQDGGKLDGEKTLIETLWDVDQSLELEQIRNTLGAFLFSGEEAEKKVSLLSGGEKSRLLFARLMLCKPNFLILDEPTNHLDLPSRILLENVLAEYEGTVLVVSHDRAFLDETVGSLFCIQDAKLTRYLGNVSENLKNIFIEKNKIENASGDKKRKLDSDKSVRIDNDKQIARGANKYKVQKIETLISELEQQLNDYEQDMLSEEAVRDKRIYEQFAEQHAAVKKELERRYEEWENICG